jgi:hypothetical protein
MLGVSAHIGRPKTTLLLMEFLKFLLRCLESTGHLCKAGGTHAKYLSIAMMRILQMAYSVVLRDCDMEYS